jgi:hypothetical protein
MTESRKIKMVTLSGFRYFQRLATIIAVMLLLPIVVCAQSTAKGETEGIVRAMLKISTVVLNDTFVPTSYGEFGDFNVRTTGIDYQVRTLRDVEEGTGGEPLIISDDGKGNAYCGSVSFSISENLTLSYLSTSTDFSGTASDKSGGIYKINRSQFDTSFTYFGYNFLGNEQDIFSFQIYLGRIYQTIKFDIDLSSVSYEGDVSSFSMYTDDSLEGSIAGLSLAIQILDFLKITLYMVDYDLGYIVYTEVNNNTGEQYYSDDMIHNRTIAEGLDIELITESNWIFGFGFDGDFIRYTKACPVCRGDYEGLEMKSYSVTVGYEF